MAKNETDSGIVILAPIVERYVFSKPLRGDSAREVYKEVKEKVARNFKNAPAFNAYFEFNEETGEIKGSNVFYGILISDVLRKSGLWIPTIAEAKKLDAKGKLSNMVYRNYGIAVYNENNPNSEIAQVLVEEANRRAWQLPILAPFKALKCNKGGSNYGATILFNEDAQGIMTGEEARTYLKEQFNYVANNGACWLFRFWDGCWGAGWGLLASSDVRGRVDFVCGEATAQNLESSVLEEADRTAQSELEKINARIAKAREAALNVLRS